MTRARCPLCQLAYTHVTVSYTALMDLAHSEFLLCCAVEDRATQGDVLPDAEVHHVPGRLLRLRDIAGMRSVSSMQRIPRADIMSQSMLRRPGMTRTACPSEGRCNSSSLARHVTHVRLPIIPLSAAASGCPIAQ